MGVLQGGMTGGLPDAALGTGGAGLGAIGGLIGERDIDTRAAVRDSNVALANLVAAAGAPGDPPGRRTAEDHRRRQKMVPGEARNLATLFLTALKLLGS